MKLQTSAEETTYLLVDGENIDATLGLSVLGRRPEPDERPRWDRVRSYVEENYEGHTRGLFFLNASDHMPMTFVQALLAMNYQPIPLCSDNPEEKVVDVGIQRTLETILAQDSGNVVLVSQDGDFEPQLRALLKKGRNAAVVGFEEFPQWGTARPGRARAAGLGPGTRNQGFQRAAAANPRDSPQ